MKIFGRKEIALPEVNGAQTEQLLFLLNRKIFYTIAVSFISCQHCCIYIFKQLAAEPYGKGSTELVHISGDRLATCGVAFFTVGYQTWKTANTNPVQALKSE